ncbi:unnamed protein product, partial [Brassica napus]
QISPFSTSSSRDFRCVPSKSTATIKLELLPLTDGIITLDTLQIHVKEKGKTKECLKMEAIDLNDDGQNDVMDEDIEDYEVLDDSEANRGTQPRQVQSRRRVSRCWKKFTILGGRLSDGDESVEKTEEEKEEEDKEKEKEEEKTSIFIHLLHVITANDLYLHLQLS